MPLLSVTKLCKSFAVPVLKDFDFTLEHGEVHALVGGNGAGKSTFANILAGLIKPDSGSVVLDGKAHSPSSRREAAANGVTLMLQELHLIPTLSIAENLFLHKLPSRLGFLSKSQLHRAAAQALEQVGLGHIDPATPAGVLGVGHQQLVVLAGALIEDCKIILLDEPTAALTATETETLFLHIRRLRSEGKGIIYISHRMEELREIADTVSVLRDGQRIETLPIRDTDTAHLVRSMAGRDVMSGRDRASTTLPDAPIALQVRHLSAPPAVLDVSFEVKAGEILGLSGLVGAGRSETLRAIFGADPRQGGSISAGNPLRPLSIRQPSDAVSQGIALVTEDRKIDGLLLPLGMKENATLADLRGLFLPRGESETVATLREKLDVRCQSIDQPTSTLSGGNQQKIVLSRWLLKDSKVLLLDEPTRGVDAGAKQAIHDLLGELAAEGKALVVVSSDIEELMSLCHRILVLSAGQVTGAYTAGSWNRELLTQAAFAGHMETQPSS
jgi:ribose transport system ATP-binding protein